MVSIRKAKQGFQLRRRNAGAPLSQAEKEKLGLVVAGLCIGVLLVVFSSTGINNSISSGDPSSATVGENGESPLRPRKPHPQLKIEEDEEEELPMLNNEPLRKQKKASPVSEAYNAMALDILETLECDKLFEEATKNLLKDGGGAKMDDFNPEQQKEKYDDQPPIDRMRRRLEENQHGDDGGFENLENAEDVGDADAQPKDDDPQGGEDEEEEKWGREAAGNADILKGLDDAPGFDIKEDDQFRDGGDDAFMSYTTLTAKHLFCLAAKEESPAEIVSRFSCAASSHKRKPLLDLWTAARAQIPDEKLLVKVLGMTEEYKSKQIFQKSYNLWAPSGDKGLEFMVNTLNNDLEETINSLAPSLGSGKLFVDVGSGSGLTTLAISQKYPGTKIVSVEPASPNWLLQELNLRCNLNKMEFAKIKIVLAGVGPNTDDEDNMMAKLMWRPTSTTSTRSWTPAEEFSSNDVELLVRLRKLRSILAEADVYLTMDGSTPNMMDVLNLDCQGCEYNLIPALKEEEFDAIPNVMGGVHWGYMPESKLPSSERGRKTHERLCQHETIAKSTKECCGFLDIPVKSNVPGEVLYRDNGENNRPEVVTVSDIIQEGLCDDYEAWATKHFVNAIKDDWGWFELSSQAK